MDVAVVGLYLAAMIAFGFWGKRRATTQSDFLVAGRRLGPLLYSGTMAAIVLGGASTIGGVGLGYEYGLSGMWLVVAIGTGILALRCCSPVGSSAWASTPSARCSSCISRCAT